MDIHKIDSTLHQSFLEEERKDAITGDLIQANDEVVFCGMCKSAFLKDSWEFISKTHCGQKNTLKDFPVAIQLLLNVPVINPVFITPLMSSFSMKEWKEHLRAFGVEDKKTVIYHKSNFIADWQNSKQVLPQVQKEIVKKTYREPSQEIAPLSYPNKLKRRIRGQKKRIKNYIDDHRDNKIWFLDSQPLVGGSVLVTVFALMITLFPAISSPIEVEVGSLILQSILILCTCPMLYILYQFTEVSFQHIKQKIILPKKSKPILKLLTSIVEETKNRNINTLFGVVENKFFVYNENNRMLSFYFNENKITIFYNFDKNLSLQLKNKNGKEISFSLVFFSKQKMSEFLITLAKQKRYFVDKSKVNLIDFPPNQEKYLKEKLSNHKEFVFVKPKPQPINKDSKKQDSKEDTESTTIYPQSAINLTDLTKLEKSQKVSKQSQNRNQHHQNRHQTQYKNYKRR